MITEVDYAYLICMKYTDEFGLIKPQLSWQNSGNGLTYTAHDVAIRDICGFEQRIDYDILVERCYKKTGLLMRNPINSFGNNQWDDYLGVTLGCELTDNRHILRQILWYGVTHAFIYDNADGIQSKDFLGRYINLWALMAASAFPWIKWAFFPILFLYSLFMTPDPNNTSGINLQFSYHYTLKKLYGNWIFNLWYKKLKKTGMTMSDSFSSYMSPEHPFSLALKDIL